MPLPIPTHILANVYILHQVLPKAFVLRLHVGNCLMLDKMPQAMITVDLAWRTEKSGNFLSQTDTKNDTQPIPNRYPESCFEGPGPF